MKKIILLNICLLFIYGIGLSQNYPKWSVNEVKDMVKKYNLQDSVTQTKNNGLLYIDKVEIDKWAQNWVKAIQRKKEWEHFFQETQKVRTRLDYYKILESHPLIIQSIINHEGGIEKYEKSKLKSLKANWRIYRNTKGELSFMPVNLPTSQDEKKLGVRIDNLPPQKE